MALFGGDVRTTPYQAPDYSGSVAAAREQSMAGAQGVAKGISQVTDYFKQQGEKKKLIKQSDIQIDAALKLFPDLAPTLQGVRDQIKDENISLNERSDIAGAVAGLINMGTKQMQANAEFGLKKRQLDIEEGQGNQSALIRRAELKAKANEPGAIFSVNVPGGERQMVRNPRTGVLEPIQVAGQTSADGITSALGDGPPMDIPTVKGPLIPATEGVISEDGTKVSYLDRLYTVDPGVLPVRTPNEPAAGIDDAISLTQPTAPPAVKDPIGFKPTKTEKPETRMTAEQVQNLAAQGFRVNARPLADGFFMVSGTDIGGQPGETIEIIPGGGVRIVRGGNAAKAEAAKKAEENKIDKAIALTQDLNLLEDRMKSMAPGVVGAAGRIVAEQIPGTFQAENKEVIDRVIATLTLENLQAMRNNSPTGAALGNVSDKDTGLMRDSATSLRNAQTPEAFKRELVRLKNLQHDVVYGSERVLKDKLSKGKIDKSQFDAAMAAGPSEYLNDRGVITTRPAIPAVSGGRAGLDQGAQDVLKEFLPK